MGKKQPSLFTYGQFQNVNLSPEDLAKLQERFGEFRATDLIEALSEYIAATGRQYKNHFAAVLMWERREREEPRPAPNLAGTPPSDAEQKFIEAHRRAAIANRAKPATRSILDGK